MPAGAPPHGGTTGSKPAHGREDAAAPAGADRGALDDRERLEVEQLRRSLEHERLAAEQLRALDRAKTTFLHAISHELRTPLAAVLGAARTLERGYGLLTGEEALDLLARLTGNARKLDRILSDLLDLGRLSPGSVEVRQVPTELAALIRGAVEECEGLRDRQVQLRTPVTWVPADPPKVERIVENLLANAVLHTGPGSSVWVRIEPGPGGAVLVVEDDGPGIPPELREAIFEPFRRGPHPAPGTPGSGIGLSLVAQFAALHGGRAWVQERPGGGASFRVLLPEARSADTAAASSGVAAPS
jgi:signal transduction histidine kinase